MIRQSYSAGPCKYLIKIYEKFLQKKEGKKNQNYQFIFKFGTWTNSNMQN